VRLKPAALRRVSLGSHLAVGLVGLKASHAPTAITWATSPTDFGETCDLHYPGEVLGVGGHTYASARSDVVKIAGNLDSYASSTWMTKNSRNSRL
jgi:hypothetical protein